MKSAASLALLLAVPAAAQQVAPAEPTSYQRAIAAGYKALTLCSGMFIAGREQRQVEALELRGVYPEYQALIDASPVVVDRPRRAVTVAWSDTLPPRQATLRGIESLGCETSTYGNSAWRPRATAFSARTSSARVPPRCSVAVSASCLFAHGTGALRAKSTLAAPFP